MLLSSCRRHSMFTEETKMLVHSKYNISATRAACTADFMFLIVLIRVIVHFVEFGGLCKCCLLWCRRRNSGCNAQVYCIVVAKSINPLAFKLWWPAGEAHWIAAETSANTHGKNNICTAAPHNPYTFCWHAAKKQAQGCLLLATSAHQ